MLQIVVDPMFGHPNDLNRGVTSI